MDARPGKTPKPQTKVTGICKQMPEKYFRDILARFSKGNFGE